MDTRARDIDKFAQPADSLFINKGLLDSLPARDFVGTGGTGFKLTGTRASRPAPQKLFNKTTINVVL